jgi:Putative adhesin
MNTASPPNTVRRAAIIGGGLLAVLLIGWGAFAVVSLIASERTTAPVSVNGSVRHVIVGLDAGGMTLHGGAATSVTGTRTVERNFRAPTFSETLTGDTLTVKSRCPSFVNSLCSVNYDLNVPADVTVEAKSSGGSLNASDLTGDLTLSSSAGSVSVTGATGRLKLSSSAGSVKVNESRSTEINARSSAGSVKISLLAPPTNVDLSSSAGSTTLELPRTSAAYDVDASSSAGSSTVTVDTSTSSARKIRVRSWAGSVQVSYSAATG